MCLAFLNYIFPGYVAMREYLSIRTFGLSTSRIHSNLFRLVTKEKVKLMEYISVHDELFRGRNTASDLYRILHLRK